MTLTLELPDDLATALGDLPEAERAHCAIDWLRIGKEVEDDEEISPDDLPPLTPEDLESIRLGLEDADAGRMIPVETVFADLRQRMELRRG